MANMLYYFPTGLYVRCVTILSTVDREGNLRYNRHIKELYESLQEALKTCVEREALLRQQSMSRPKVQAEQIIFKAEHNNPDLDVRTDEEVIARRRARFSQM